jgi:hypothetical protein
MRQVEPPLNSPQALVNAIDAGCLTRDLRLQVTHLSHYMSECPLKSCDALLEISDIRPNFILSTLKRLDPTSKQLELLEN